jgi:deoxyhypusine synthase
MIYFHSFRNPGFIIDIVQDIRSLNELSRKSRKAGMIVLGGGVCKHQIANAMLIVSETIALQNYSDGDSSISATGRIFQYTLWVSK